MPAWLWVIIIFLGVGAVVAFFRGEVSSGSEFLKGTVGYAVVAVIVVVLFTLVLYVFGGGGGSSGPNYDPPVCTNMGCE